MRRGWRWSGCRGVRRAARVEPGERGAGGPARIHRRAVRQFEVVTDRTRRRGLIGGARVGAAAEAGIGGTEVDEPRRIARVDLACGELGDRSEERREGKESGSTCRYRWSQYH